MAQQPFWSIIVPAYNEVSRLHHLNSIIEYLKKLPESYELIIVDDGSKDETKTKLLQLAKSSKLQVISYPQNRGKGYAIQQGMLAANGEYCLFLDIDLSTPIDQIEKFRPLLSPKAVLVGTRKSKGAVVNVHQPWLRETLGKGFTLLSQISLWIWISDFTCGFKCFPKAAAKKIFSASKIYRWGFDSEIIYLAKKYKYDLREVPVVWTNDAATRVKFPQDLIISLVELFKIRYNDLVSHLY